MNARSKEPKKINSNKEKENPYISIISPLTPKGEFKLLLLFNRTLFSMYLAPLQGFVIILIRPKYKPWVIFLSYIAKP